MTDHHNTHAAATAPPPSSLRSLPLLATALAALAVLLIFVPSAQASKQAVDFFGGEGTLGGQFGFDRGGVAVNDTGAGPANPGDVYAADPRNNRIERFGRDDNGTPASTADDTYFFISAWGAGVDSSIDGTDYEICTIAPDCQAGTASAGNGTAAGDGALGENLPPGGVALDQDTGELYVSDDGNNRVNVYDGTGAFLRSFGYDVDATTAGTGYEVCPAADVCKAGLTGSGAGQIGVPFEESAAQGIAVSTADGNPATGTVFLADAGNRRIDTYGLDGAGPSSFGSGHFPDNGFSSQIEPTAIAVDSRGIVYIAAGGRRDQQNPRIERYDSQNADGGGVGFLAPILSPQDEKQILSMNATAGQFRLSFDPDGAGPQPPETTGDLDVTDPLYGADPHQVSAALQALPSIGPGNVSVVGNTGLGKLIPRTGDETLEITFTGALANTDVEQLVVSNGATPLTGSIPVTTLFNGHPGLASSEPVFALAVDPDEDGAGPETDVLYAARGLLIQQFGSLNPPGLAAPPAAIDDTHATSGAFDQGEGLAVEPSTGRLYATANGKAGQGVYVLDLTAPPPTATLDSVSAITAHSADLHATIDPNGPPATRYHVEYSTDGVNWLSAPEVFLGVQETPQTVNATLEPPPLGLSPNTLYHVRVVAGRKFATPIVSNELTFTTAVAAPLVETAGAPVRTTTTAQLNGRVIPNNSVTSYRFEYGTDETYGQLTPSAPAGSGELTELVGEEIEGLTPDTTYHYRLLAENGVGSPVPGADMTVRTRASDQLPGQSDKFPGPPGSDRAWEQVSIGDSSGNPVGATEGFSDDGNRALYGIFGGTPISTTGSFLSFYFAERSPSGWQTRLISPPRDQLAGTKWFGLLGPDDLSTMVVLNVGSDTGATRRALWRLNPSGSPAKLFEPLAPQQLDSSFGTLSGPFGISADGSLAAAFLRGGTLDPAYPVASANANVYDVDSVTPKLLSLLPGNLISPCGLSHAVSGSPDSHWISADGSLVYFGSQGAGPCGLGGAPSRLYLREVEAEQTKLVSGPPLSGPECGARLIRGTPGTAFFATASRLDPADGEPASCNANAGGANNDVYRYDSGDGSLKCVTCAIAGFNLGVEGEDSSQIAVSEDGSRVYFTTKKRLLPGAPPDGQRAIYRLDVAGGELAYVAPIAGENIGTDNNSIELSPDGSTLVFSSKLAALNPLGGVSDNGGSRQYYRYDDTDRSLICASCPQDGSAPVGEERFSFFIFSSERGQSNKGVLSEDGKTFAFSTPTPLVGADQNTPGAGQNPEHGGDVYEWRDGRLLLVTDGLSNRSLISGLVAMVSVDGITPSGRDIFFDAPAQYTPDAPDANRRLYDARIDGGIEFPPQPPPCSLEVCQGTPKGAPEEQEPASRNFSGSGNVAETKASRCPKGKREVRHAGKAHCVKPRKPRHHRAAKHNRRAHR